MLVFSFMSSQPQIDEVQKEAELGTMSNIVPLQRIIQESHI